MIAIGLAIGFTVPMRKRVQPPAQAVATSDRPREVVRETRLARYPNGHFYTEAFVNGKTVRFIVDTGATDVALTLDDARVAGIQVDPAKFEVVGVGASGAVMGQNVSLSEVNLEGKRVRDIRGVVLQGLTVSLLGQNYLRQLHSVEITSDTMTLR